MPEYDTRAAISRLTDYIEANQMSWSDLARAVDVTYRQVLHWRRGDSRPSIETAKRIEARTAGAVPWGTWF